MGCRAAGRTDATVSLAALPDDGSTKGAYDIVLEIDVVCREGAGVVITADADAVGREERSVAVCADRSSASSNASSSYDTCGVIIILGARVDAGAAAARGVIAIAQEDVPRTDAVLRASPLTTVGTFFDDGGL